MYKSKSPPLVRLLLAVLALLAFTSLPALADKVIVTVRDTAGTQTAYPTYTNWTISAAGVWYNSSGLCTPVEDSPGTKVQFHPGTSGSGVGAFRIRPTLANPGHTYRLDHAGTVATAIAADTTVDLAINSGGGTLSTNRTLTFSKTYGPYTTPYGWTNICYITNASANPEITFTYSSFLIDGVTPQAEATASTRFFACAFRFTDITDPCVETPAPGQVYGPLSVGQTLVDVPGIVSGSTNVTVYADGVQIGILTSGVVAGVNTVTVSPLVQGKKIVATQTYNGIESCKPTASFAGPIVGSGANPSTGIQVSLVLQQNAALTGPIGASTIVGSADVNTYHKPATGNAGYGGAPAGGILVPPSTCWQTVTINPTDPAYAFLINSGNGAVTDPNTYAALCGIGFSYASGSSDTGPFVIYVNRIMNGTTIVQDFEGYPDGTSAVLLNVPSAAGILGNDSINVPNVSQTTTAQAADGTNSAVFSFQFKNPVNNQWQRGVLNGNYQTNPIVDITQPITLHLLLLPVGQTAGHFLGDASVASVTNCPGDNATLTATVTGGTGPFTYQWKRNGTTITGATLSTYTTNGVVSASSGTYTCVVSDGNGCSASPAGTLTVPTAVQFDTQPTDAGVQPDGTGYAYFSAAASIPDTCPCAKNPAIIYRWYFNGAPLTDTATITGSSGSGNSPMYPGLTIYPTYYSNAGNYTLVASNTCVGQVVTSAVAKLWVTPNAQVYAACQSQPGLLGLYYTNHTSASAFSGSRAWTNVDSSITFDWLTGGFEPGQFPIATDYFTVRWVGMLQTPFDPGTGQSYTFYTRSDDGVRLWVNGQLLIDKWVPQGATTWTGSIVLTTNKPADLILEYFEQTGNASVELAYESLSMPSNSIPSSQLCAAVPGQAGAGGIPPLLTLTAPTNNATATFPVTVTLSASVAPQDATINKVEFYHNGTNLLGTVAAPGPYTTSWTPPSADVYNITTRVTYNTTSTLNSPSNKLTVALPLAAAVTITNISGTTLTYGGGNGAQFVLVKSATVNAPLNTWTRVATNTLSPGVFTIPAVGTETAVFYRVKSE